MKITKFKKIAGSKYKIFFDNGENILLHENIIIKYNLLITKKIEEDYDDIIKDNNNYMIYDMTVKYISKKMRCESEIRKYLKSKGINDELSDRIIVKLRENGLLNDRDYIKSYISDVYNELVNKVTWPTWSELQSSATIVMIASVIIALCIFAMDFSFRHIVTGIYNLFY